MSLRMLRDVLVLTALALLPAVVAGCAKAVADPMQVDRPAREAAGPREIPGRGGFARTGSAPKGSGLSYLVPRQSMPAAGEELWVIQKRLPGQERDDGQTPGGGSLFVPRGGEQVPVPLKHTDVKASVVGDIGTVDVVQQFHNPFDGKIEAVYVFPLPHDAAITEFVMTVGERKIRGIIREREEAKQIYEQAKGQGYVASLLEQDRPNVFTQKVANIEPGKRIDVSVRYFHTLGYSDGWYEWVFPMVVGPRFNPPGSSDGIGATGRGGRGKSGQKTEVQYLRPEDRSGHDVAVAVNVDALVPVESVERLTHKIRVERSSPRVAAVTLDAGGRVPNKDFVLRWKVAGEGVRSGLVV